jgi:hypothetical protein
MEKDIAQQTMENLLNLIDEKKDVIKIKTNNQSENEVIGLSAPKGLTLEEMQTFVGGYIQPIYPSQHTSKRLASTYTMYCNEEGKLNGLNLNPIATIIANIDDVIVGDVFLIRKDLEN